MKNTVKKINRREAIIKTGKYTAVTAAATFMILSPKQSQANSPTTPGWGESEPQNNNSEIDKIISVNT